MTTWVRVACGVVFGSLFFCIPAVAADLSGWREHLIPVTSVQGANGTEWMAELTVLNPAHEAVEGTLGPCQTTCVSRLFPPGTTVMNVVPSALTPFRSLYHEKPLLLSLRVTESTGLCEGWGTAVPVPDRSTFKAVVHLASVPTDPAYRVHLRMYMRVPDFDFEVPEGWRVRVYDQASGNLLAMKELYYVDSGPHVLVKQRFVFNIAQEWPEILQADRIRLEIEKISPRDETAIWGFVTVTDHRSQQFTVIEPPS